MSTQTTECHGCGAWLASGQYHRNDCPTVAAPPATMTTSGTGPAVSQTTPDEKVKVRVVAMWKDQLTGRKRQRTTYMTADRFGRLDHAINLPALEEPKP